MVATYLQNTPGDNAYTRLQDLSARLIHMDIEAQKHHVDRSSWPAPCTGAAINVPDAEEELDGVLQQKYSYAEAREKLDGHGETARRLADQIEQLQSITRKQIAVKDRKEIQECITQTRILCRKTIRATKDWYAFKEDALENGLDDHMSRPNIFSPHANDLQMAKTIMGSDGPAWPVTELWLRAQELHARSTNAQQYADECSENVKNRDQLISALEEQIGTTTLANNLAREETEKLTQSLARKEEEIGDAQRATGEGRTRIASLEQELLELKTSTAKQLSEAAEEYARDLSAQRQEHAQEREAIRKEQSSNAANLTSAQEQALAVELQSLKRENGLTVTAKDTIIDKLSSEITATREQVKSLQTKDGQQTEKIASLEGRIASKEEIQVSLVRHAHDSLYLRDDAKREAKDVAVKLAEEEDQHRAISAKLQQLEASLDIHYVKRDEYTTLNEEKNKATKIIDEMKSREEQATASPHQHSLQSCVPIATLKHTESQLQQAQKLAEDMRSTIGAKYVPKLTYDDLRQHQDEWKKWKANHDCLRHEKHVQLKKVWQTHDCSKQDVFLDKCKELEASQRDLTTAKTNEDALRLRHQSELRAIIDCFKPFVVNESAPSLQVIAETLVTDLDHLHKGFVLEKRPQPTSEAVDWDIAIIKRSSVHGAINSRIPPPFKLWLHCALGDTQGFVGMACIEALMDKGKISPGQSAMLFLACKVLIYDVYEMVHNIPRHDCLLHCLLVARSLECLLRLGHGNLSEIEGLVSTLQDFASKEFPDSVLLLAMSNWLTGMCRAPTTFYEKIQPLVVAPESLVLHLDDGRKLIADPYMVIVLDSNMLVVYSRHDDEMQVTINATSSRLVFKEQRRGIAKCVEYWELENTDEMMGFFQEHFFSEASESVKGFLQRSEWPTVDE